jgi:hypothetical protein
MFFRGFDFKFLDFNFKFKGQNSLLTLRSITRRNLGKFSRVIAQLDVYRLLEYCRVLKQSELKKSMPLMSFKKSSFNFSALLNANFLLSNNCNNNE